MSTNVVLPFYSINSDLLKLMFGVKTKASVVDRLKKLNIPIISQNNISIVRHQDLVNIGMEINSTTVHRYKGKSKAAKGLLEGGLT